MLLLRGGTVVTLAAGGHAIDGGAVLIEGDRIRAVGRADRLAATPGITRTIVVDDHLILPGLVNAHNHCFQTLYRGVGKDRGLADWSAQTIYPLSRWLTARDAEAATQLACLEMLSSGITTFVDSHYVHVDREAFDGVARAALASGMRAVLGRAAVDAPLVPEPFREAPDVARREVERAIARWHGAGNGRLRVRPEALSERAATPAMIQAMLAAARNARTGFNMHLGESQQAVERVRRDFGKSSLQLLRDLGGLAENTLLAHAIWLDEADLDLLAATRTAVAHNPVSNLYLGTGVAPVPEMLARGAVVGLGTDGAASNNNLDMFGVMKTCGLLFKGRARSAAGIPADSILRMATRGGAAAVGLSEEIGSLEPGKKADVIALSLSRPELVPCVDVAESLVYSAVPECVDLVVVDGQVVVEHRMVRTLDRDAVLRDARAAAMRLVEAAGLG